jgi:DNA (cytosine-5)-methyltransferase 1
MKPAWHSEIEPYPSRVLAERWPGVPNLGDIKTIEWSTVEPVDVVCGGYPCPAFSQAARGRNVAENLWPWMRDAIDALRPRYAVLENVAAHLHRGFDEVLGDLADLGFDAEWEVVTACAFGAPHPRRRLFVVAYANGYGEPVVTLDEEAPVLSASPGHRGDRWEATADDVGADHGVPHRVDRLRALGNAVVPQVAEWFGRRIVEGRYG